MASAALPLKICACRCGCGEAAMAQGGGGGRRRPPLVVAVQQQERCHESVLPCMPMRQARVDAHGRSRPMA